MLDGAWGVLIHRRGLSEEEYRGERFRDHSHDVKGDPDLLNLTLRGSSPRSTTPTSPRVRTSRPRTPSRRPASGRRTTRSETLPAEMSLEGARLARQAADAWTAQDSREAAVRGRFGRPAQRHALAVAARRRPRVPGGHVRPGAGGVRGAGRRAPGRRRRPSADRDDLRHAEREGGDRRGARPSRPSSRSGSRSPPSTGAVATSPARPPTPSGSRSSMPSRSSSG